MSAWESLKRYLNTWSFMKKRMYVEAQKAVHWVVENQLMEPESENVFGAQKSVGKLKILQLMIKTNNLMQAKVQ